MALKEVAVNRKARHQYQVLETVEAGLCLTGPEVKAIRLGRVSLADAYAKGLRRELYLYNLNIAPYDPVWQKNYDPRRPRKLLLHRKQIDRLLSLAGQKGLTLVPLRLYFNDRGFAKVELALVRGKGKADRRQEILKREAEREIRQALKRQRNN
ncbi:MAG: SsrA-binding protein SmpB [Armatimonadetes bacterium]|nr:SsrA-binding protein SmpB [Armatimonadota bacterium]MDW8122094.1 SsrA-binding protein SmpB [Armatimonadota bacterium]